MDQVKWLAAADVLRSWALDEELKTRVTASPPLARIAAQISRRYCAGETVDEALVEAREVQARGHRLSVEYAGESVRSAEVADAETQVFVDLAERLRAHGIEATVSADLSHIGALVDRRRCLRNATRIVDALEPLGTALMISAEGSERTDLILDLYEELVDAGCNVGITVQARLHRTPDDLKRLLALPGPIRLVKGAFLEPESVAFARDSPQQQEAWLDLARQLLESGHRVALATHDQALIETLLAESPQRCASPQVEFEMLRGLGTQLLDTLQQRGFATREYAIFGPHWWLYVLNRLAESTDRLFDAIVDMDHLRRRDVAM